MDFDWMAARDSVLASQQQTADRLTASFERQRLAEGQLEDMAEYVKYLKELAELRRIADAAEAQAKLAMQEAKDAKKDAKFSKCLSIISIAVALIVGIAQAVLQLL